MSALQTLRRRSVAKRHFHLLRRVHLLCVAHLYIRKDLFLCFTLSLYRNKVFPNIQKSVCDTSTPLPLILEGWVIFLSFFSDILYMNILQQIFKDNYEIIQYTLHPRDVELENISKMINCGESMHCKFITF